MKQAARYMFGAMMLMAAIFAVKAFANSMGPGMMGNQKEMQQMSGMMQDMSMQMKDMSDRMAKNGLNEPDQKHMAERMDRMAHMMNGMSGMMGRGMMMDATMQKQMEQMRKQMDEMMKGSQRR